MSKRQVFYDLLSELEQDEEKDTDEVFDRIQAQYGIRHQIYINLSLAAGQQNVLDMRHTFPEDFVEFYRKKGLFSLDPVMQSALTGIKPVDWRVYHLGDPTAEKIFAIAAEYGVSDIGMTIPLLCRGSQAAMFAVNADMTPKEWSQYRLDVIGDIQVLATYLHSARQELAQERLPTDLTARESEVLTWTAAGKSYWEISMILGISERTVRFFMTNARHKLGVVTNPQAVAQAVWRGIIPL
ncbi:autoinducer binding domain-containing protein [Hoeflea sp. TYP-13]|uniref:helix-turn-helix transcriptional regulator n=1 Tax=Hoeflea sp. TYP-13 TaxID=3230023 RepID=UPI0034C639FB